MGHDAPPPSNSTTIPMEDDRAREPRMSFGDHLDELRTCLVRATIGTALVTVVTLVFGKEILAFVCQPLHAAMIANGLPPSVQVLAPTGAFLAYLKISFLSALIISMPWILYQAWVFIGTGLYSHERRFVRMLVPISTGLFALGVAFLYFVVLPIVLNFFIAFNKAFDTPPQTQSLLQSLLLPTATDEATADTADGAVSVPLRRSDPDEPTTGEIWVNTTSRRLIIQTHDGVLSTPLSVGPSTSAMNSQFAIDFYVSFVMTLALAFGIAFEMPVVVFFLAWSRIVSTATMAKGRHYVLLGIIVAAAMLTPPDVISQMLLALPMYALFELGILIARIQERKRPEA